MTERPRELPQREPQGVRSGTGHAREDEVDLTGDAGVDAVLARLTGMHPDLDPAAQLPVLAEIHQALQERLSSTEG